MLHNSTKLVKESLEEYSVNPKNMIYPQLISAKAKGVNPRMEYLQLQLTRPKPILSLEPDIEADFIMHSMELKRMQKPVDEKVMKRKIKEHEKVAIRELNKDTLVV